MSAPPPARLSAFGAAARAGESARPPDASTAAAAARPASPRADSFEESTGSDPTGSKDDGGGNETDVEDAADEPTTGSGEGEGSSEERIAQAVGEGRAMYPFPGNDHRWRRVRRGSSAIVEPSSATDSDAEDDDEEMASVEGGAGSARGRKKRTRTATGGSLSFPHPHPHLAAAAPVPRLRRVGALGISVHSDSDDQLNPAISGLDSDDLRRTKEGEGESSDTRATDLGISTSQLRSSAEDVPGRRKKKRRRVGDSTFRGVVDDLVLQNRELQGRLKRYEARGVPDEVKRDRLFEIRFGPALPADKRVELETYLTRYVQDFVQHPEDDKLPPTPAPASSPLPSHTLPAPTPRPRPKAFYLGEDQLAGPSNSGVEPVSMSGTGSGMALPPPPPPPMVPLRPVNAPATIDSSADEAVARDVVASLELLFYHSLIRNAAARSPPPPPASTSVHTRTPAASTTTSPTLPSPSNESYFSNLLSHDYLSQGFVYTNLACTMAEIHRFPVTLSFVQQAIRQFSSRLEVSDDGGRIRWVGPRDVEALKREMGGADEAEEQEQQDDVLPLPASAEAAEDTTPRSSVHSLRSGNLQRLPGADGEPPSSSALARTRRAARQPSSGTATSSSQTTTSSSRDPSSGDGTAPTTSGGSKSLAAPSTAETSQYPSSGQDSGDGQGKGKGKEEAAAAVATAEEPKPVRPVAAVLQPMGRLRESSGESASRDGAAGEGAAAAPSAAAKQLDSATTADAVRGSAGQASAGSVPRPRMAHRPSSSYRAKNLFDRLQEADDEGKVSVPRGTIEGDSSPLRGEDLIAEARSGMLVFYANQHFCSDLSKEDGHPAPPALPTPPGDAQEKKVALGATGPLLVRHDERRQSEDESAQMSLEDDSAAPSSGLLDVEMGDSGSPSSRSGGEGSGTSSFERLRTSGMTSTKPADLFTLVVKSQYPLHPATKRSLDALSSVSLDDDDAAPSAADPPLKKRHRPFSPPRPLAPRILSTETVYHSATSKNRDPFELAFLSSSSLVGSGSTSGKTSEEELSEEEDRVQHLLTSSNLALLSASQAYPNFLHDHPTLPPAPHLIPIPETLLPPSSSPPNDDYLLSLSAPSHSWAPREPGLNSRAGTLALSMKAGSLQLDLGAASSAGVEKRAVAAPGRGRGGTSSIGGMTMTSTGDERPISLDEMVGLTKAQLAGLQGSGGGR
ncbi:hypothetical protein JCM6882_008036 [Rhodosporidiobolus microsporus]